MKFLDLVGLKQVVSYLKARINTAKIEAIETSQDYTDSYPEATTSAKGFMSKMDKVKLNSLHNFDATGLQTQINELDSEKANKSDLTTVFKYKGSKAKKSLLPTTGNVIGDVWNVDSTDDNYCWSGTVWDKLGGTYNPYVKSVNGKTPNSAGAITIPNATQSASGVMSKEDKKKLNGINPDNLLETGDIGALTEAEINEILNL